MNTSDNITYNQAEGVFQEWRVSWIAYIPYALVAVIIICVLSMINDFTSRLMIAGALLVVMCYLAYKAYYLYRMRLYMDDNGVWVYRGVFPWDRGVYGMKWRDFEDVIYRTGFFYWIVKGYPVTMRPRFSNNPKVSLPPIHRGRTAVETINFMAMTNEKAPPR